MPKKAKLRLCWKFIKKHFLNHRNNFDPCAWKSVLQVYASNKKKKGTATSGYCVIFVAKATDLYNTPEKKNFSFRGHYTFFLYLNVKSPNRDGDFEKGLSNFTEHGLFTGIIGVFPDFSVKKKDRWNHRRNISVISPKFFTVCLDLKKKKINPYAYTITTCSKIMAATVCSNTKIMLTIFKT